MDALNLPVEMIAVCGQDGTLRPVRFRLETPEGRVVVLLRRIDTMKSIRYVGQEAVQYFCRGVLGDRERQLELRYILRSHRWFLFRFLD